MRLTSIMMRPWSRDVASGRMPGQLDAEFNREKHFLYKGISEDAFVEHIASFVATIWQIHPFREGNTRTMALFVIKYLRSKGLDVTNDLFAKKSWYFRNALVRANYENAQQDVVKESVYLEDFFKVLLWGADIELKNRFLRIGFEYGTKAADSVTELHRKLPIGRPELPIDIGMFYACSRDSVRRTPLAQLKSLRLLASRIGHRVI